MNPYALHMLARIHHEERLVQAEAARRLRFAKRAQRREAPAIAGTAASATVPACSTG